MANRRRRRKSEKERRHAPKPVRVSDAELGGPVEPVVYSREQAAQALAISLATLDRRVVPATATVRAEWGRRLIPVTDLKRYLAERTEQPREPRPGVPRLGRRPAVPPDVVERIRREHAEGISLAEIARRLNHDGIPTGQGGRRWWPSTVQAILRSSTRRNRQIEAA
jgi:hypothetical protein